MNASVMMIKRCSTTTVYAIGVLVQLFKNLPVVLSLNLMNFSVVLASGRQLLEEKVLLRKQLMHRVIHVSKTNLRSKKVFHI